MFTMEQIRNMVFALIDQSTMNDRITLNEHRYVSIFETGLRLAEKDDKIDSKAHEMHDKVSIEVA